MTDHPAEVAVRIAGRERPGTLVATAADGTALYEYARAGKARGSLIRQFVLRTETGALREWTRRAASGYRQTWRYAPRPPATGNWAWLKEGRTA